MSVADLMEAMAAAGAPTAAIILAVRALEERDAMIEETRAKNRERKRRERASRDSHATVTPLVTPSLSETKSSPTPLQKTQPIPEPPSPPMGAHGSKIRLVKPNGFARFWEAYPRKIGKGAAERAFETACRKIAGPDPPGVLMAALERVKPTWREPEFIPHPTTWLNQGRWEDEIETPDGRQPQPSDRIDPKRAAREANYARSLAGFDVATAGRAER